MKYITIVVIIYQIAFLLCAKSGLKTNTVTATVAKTLLEVKSTTKSKSKSKNKNEASAKSENSAAAEIKTSNSLEVGLGLLNALNTSAENSNNALSAVKDEAKFSNKDKTSDKAKSTATTTVSAKTGTSAESKTENSNGLKSLFTLYDTKLDPSLANEMFKMYASGKIKGGAPIKVPNGPVFWQGWVKYFHFLSSKKWKRPHSFFENSKYYSQRVLQKDFKKKDKNGFLYIPSRDYFYASLEKDSLNIMSDRETYTKNAIDTLNTNLILPVAEDNKYYGGIQRLGEFKEGFCIQIGAKIPISADTNFIAEEESDGDDEQWILCTQTVQQRDNLLETLINLKILKQKASGQDFSGNRAPPQKPSLSNVLNPKPTPKIERYSGKGADPFIDGYWILLWDWSQCTLKCGGGLEYQQWMCVPPKTGGKPCQGQSIRTRPCNMKPCPKTNGFDPRHQKEEVTLKPIIRSMPFSARPQRFIQCEIKETDVFYLRYDTAENIGVPVKYPARVIMNNRTIALYTDDNLENSVFTFNLPDTDVKKSEMDHCCIELFSMNVKQTLCTFEQECGTEQNPVFANNWIKDIDMFSKKCYHNLPKHDNSDGNGNDGDKGKGPGIASLADRRNIIKANLKKLEQSSLVRKISRAQDTTLKAIKKELKMEELIKREMQLKAKEELKALLALKKREELKKNCLLKALKERDRKAEDLHKNTQGELEVEREFIEAKKDIKANRDNLKKKLEAIKKKAARRKRMIEQQISLIRGEMAKNLIDANKLGNMEICRRSNNDVVKVKEYCDANFIDNYLKNTNCKEMENFCYICCENEFGNMYMRHRDKCYTMCDDLVKKDLEGGDWVWAKGIGGEQDSFYDTLKR